MSRPASRAGPAWSRGAPATAPATPQRPTRGNGATRAVARDARARQELEAQKRERDAVVRERELHLMALEERTTRELQRRLEALLAARELAVSRIGDVLGRATLRRRLRAAHTTEALLASRSPRLRKALKSDVRKGTALVKRVAVLTEDTMDVLLRDVEAYNLSRYSAEMARAVIHERLRVQDVEHVVALSSSMHQRYADYFPALFAVVCRDLRAAVGVLLGGGAQALAGGGAPRSAASAVCDAIDAAQVWRGSPLPLAPSDHPATPAVPIAGARPAGRL